ncbi:MAG: hypothetical protein ACK5OW_00875 [bacterium]|jgi:hypothetical protein
MGNLILKEQSVSGFTAAPLNKIKIAYGNDDNLYRIDDANNAVVIGGGGGSQTLAQTLALGNTSGAYDILMNTTQRIGFKDGDNTYTTYLSNNITTAANRTVYLPLFDGQLAYHATGTPPTTNYVLKGTTNGAITSGIIYDNGTNVGIGTSSPTTKLSVYAGTVTNTDLFSVKIASNQAALNVNDANWVSINSNTRVGTESLYINGTQVTSEISILGTNMLRFADSGFSTITSPNLDFVGTMNGGYQFNGYGTLPHGNSNFLSLIPNTNNGSLATFFNNLVRIKANGNTDTQKYFAVTSFTADTIPTDTLTYFKGSTSAAGAYALKVDNSSSNPLLHIANTINGQANGLNQGNGNLAMYYDTSGAGYAVLRSLNYNSVSFGTHSSPYRIILGRDGNVYTNDRLFVMLNDPIAAVTETVSVGRTTHGVNGSTSSMVVLNITMGSTNSGLGLFAIGATGQGGTTGNATMNFKYDPISYSGTVNSANNNYYRVAIGKSPSTDYRLEISGGTRIESDSYTTSAAVLELSSTTQGLLLPRMTSTQASAITAVNGLILYVTDTNLTFTSVGFWGYENGSWVKL